MSDNDFYQQQRLWIENEKISQREKLERMKRDTAERVAQIRATAQRETAEAMQNRRESLTREGWRRDDERRAQDDTRRRDEINAHIQVEQIKADSAIDLATHQTNLAIQSKHLGNVFDELGSRRKIAETGHTALADGYKAVVGELVRGAVQTKLERVAMERRDREHAQALELERVKLENDLLRAEMEHERTKGREQATREHEIIMATLQSGFRNTELTHAESIRLVVRLIERALSMGDHKLDEEQVREWVREFETEGRAGGR